MIENFQKDKYPTNIAAGISSDQCPSILSVLKESCQRFATKPAFTNLGRTLTYGELYKLSGDFAAYLQQHTDLKPSDRIATQLPSVLQYPVVVFGAMRAGLIVVNTNPLYAARGLEHQFDDSGAKTVICLADMTHLVGDVLPKTSVKQVITAEVDDILPPLKCFIINFVVKHIRKMVPAYSLSQATKLTNALARGAGKSSQEVAPQADDVIVLQYTGGTTDVARSAMLAHRNLVANMLQCKALMGANLNEDCEILIAPLPLYHIYAFTFHRMAMILTGSHNILITNPRDLPSMLKDLGQWKFTGFVGLNTLFVTLCNSEIFRKLDLSALKLTLSGGMTLQLATAERWKEITGYTICENYGMTEAAPVVSVNPFQNIQVGTVGIPMPSTLCEMIGDDGQEVSLDERGELCVRGPQVTGGYWQHQGATDEILDTDGWLKTDGIATTQEDDYMHIIDRKKDMILVSGFNVYPSGLEDVLATLPDVLRYAAVDIPGERSGESIKVFVVVKPGATLAKEQVAQHMHDSLTDYRRPKAVEFRDSLPATNVGKILRCELRGEELKKMGQK